MANSKTRPRVRWVGALEITYVFIAVLVVVSAVYFGWIGGRSAAHPTQAAIAAESHRYPLRRVHWTTTVPTAFGSIDLPGPARTFHTKIAGGDKVTAVAVGGHGAGIAAAEVRYSYQKASPLTAITLGGIPPQSVEATQLASRLFGELGGAPPSDAIPLMDGVLTSRSGRVPTDATGIHESGPVRYDGSTIRVAIVTRHHRKVMIVTQWPIGTPDPLTARLLDSVAVSYTHLTLPTKRIV